MALNNSINAPIPFAATKGGSGVASPTIHGILVAQGASPFATKVLTDGQLLIGSTGVDPVAASLIAGTNVTITPGAGTITIAASGASYTWNDITTSTQALSVNQGYVVNNGASLVTFTLPATAAFGTEIDICGYSVGGWKIAQNAGQSINFGDTSTTTGTGGYIASSSNVDQIRLLCVTTNTTWNVRFSVGNLDVV